MKNLSLCCPLYRMLNPDPDSVSERFAAETRRENEQAVVFALKARARMARPTSKQYARESYLEERKRLLATAFRPAPPHEDTGGELQGSTVDSKSIVSGSIPDAPATIPATTRLIISHGATSTSVERFQRSIEFDNLPDAYEEYHAVCLHAITWARLSRRLTDGKLLVEYGWGKSDKSTPWRAVTVPRMYRTSKLIKKRGRWRLSGPGEMMR